MMLRLVVKLPPVASAQQDEKWLSSRREAEKESWGCGVFFCFFVFLCLGGMREGGFTPDSREQEKQERKLEGFYVK